MRNVAAEYASALTLTTHDNNNVVSNFNNNKIMISSWNEKILKHKYVSVWAGRTQLLTHSKVCYDKVTSHLFISLSWERESSLFSSDATENNKTVLFFTKFLVL